jgi:hypothetical protein
MSRPDRPCLSKRDYLVAPVSHARSAALIRTLHYSRSCANTSVYSHGIFRVSDHALVGAAVWLPPPGRAANPVARLLDVDPLRVLSLSRLVVAPDVPTNGASFLLGGSIRIIDRDRFWRALVTYADPIEGHSGAIYRASNWTEAGISDETTRWIKEGSIVSQKATRSRTVEEMIAAGAVRAGKSRKIRFVKRLSDPDPKNPEARKGQLAILMPPSVAQAGRVLSILRGGADMAEAAGENSGGVIVEEGE